MAYLPFDALARKLILDRFLASSRPPEVAEIAASLDVDATEAARSLDRLAGEHVVVLERGSHRIEMVAPFSAIPTSHVVSDGEREWFVNCAWDALALAFLVERDCRIRSRCPDCDAPIELTARGPEVEGEAIFHISVPARRWWEDIRFT